MANFVFITPTHGEVRAETVNSVVATMAHYKNIIGWVLNVGSALLTRNRDISIGKFLKEYDKPYAILLDSDMTFKPEDIEKLMVALEDGRDFVAGVCTTGDRFVINTLGDSSDFKFTGDVVEVAGTSVAFTGISRRILEKMIADLDLPLVPTARRKSGEPGPTYPGFFQQVGFVDKDGVTTAVSEDYSFNERVKSVGGKIWVHTGVLPGHVKSMTISPYTTAMSPDKMPEGLQQVIMDRFFEKSQEESV